MASPPRRSDRQAELERIVAAAVRAPGKATWRALLDAAGVPARLRNAILESMAPTARAVTRPMRGNRLGVSRLGGLPDVGPGFAWPEWNDEVLAFVGQIRLAELPSAVRRDLGVPRDGLLSFFFAADEQPWGGEPDDLGGARVYFWPSTALQPAKRPRRLPKQRVFHARRLVFRETRTVADPWSWYGHTLEVDASAEQAWLRALAAWYGAHGQPYHVVGGHAARIQPTPLELLCALTDAGIDFEQMDMRRKNVRAAVADADAWRLVLQVDSDEDVGWVWSDAGKLSFWMRDADIAAMAVDRAGFGLQSG